MPFTIRVAVLRASGLAAKDRGGTSDPFCIVRLGNVRYRTNVILKELNPVWNQVFDFGPFDDIVQLPTLLTVVCWDKDRFRNDFLGHFELPISDLFCLVPLENGGDATKAPTLVPKPISFAEAPEAWYTLEKRRAKGDVSGAVCLKIGVVGPGLEVPSAGRDRDLQASYETLLERTEKLHIYAKESSAGSDEEGSDDENERNLFKPHKPNRMPAEFDAASETSDRSHQAEQQAGLGLANRSATPKPSKFAKWKRKRESTHTIAINSSSLLGLVNLEIVSLTNLPRKKNLTRTSFDSDPFVVVTFGKLTFKTRVIPHNLNPVFNERLYFNVQQSELKYSLKLSVYDYDMFSSHDHLGSVVILIEKLIFEHPDGSTQTHTYELTPSEGRPQTSPAAITIRLRFTPYSRLRRQFWKALSREFDNDVNGKLNRIEVESLLESINSTLSEHSVDSFFQRYRKDPESDELTIDEFVEAIEERMCSPPTPPSSPFSLQIPSEDNSSAGFSIHREPSPCLSSPLSPADMSSSLPERVISVKYCPVCRQSNLSGRDDIDVISHIAVCSSEDPDEVGRILMGNVGTEARIQRKWLPKVAEYMGYGKWAVGANNANIIVQVRATGELIEEKMPVYIKLGIRLLYKAMGSSRVESKRIRRLLRTLSIKQGRKFDDPRSVRDIPGFIRFHNINVSEIRDPLESFRNFNEFFYRHLKPDARPIDSPDDPSVAVSPADCRCMVFPSVDDATRIWIKGTQFALPKLFGDKRRSDETCTSQAHVVSNESDSEPGKQPGRLGSGWETSVPSQASALAKEFEGGAMVICRLAPQDYHRFHIPVDGILSSFVDIDGEYYTVNPMAIRSPLDVYGENKRCYSIIESAQFGRVAYICIGAMMVGSIVLTSTPGVPLKRGDDHGYFAFGGSTVLLLFQPGRITMDSDLVNNSAQCLETLIRVGNSIGVASARPPAAPLASRPVSATPSSPRPAAPLPARNCAALQNQAPSTIPPQPRQTA